MFLQLMTTRLCDFMRNVIEYQIDASFESWELTLNYPISEQNSLARLVFMKKMNNKKYFKLDCTNLILSVINKKRYCFRKHINPLHILWEEELISTLDFFLFLHSHNGQFLAYILYFLYIFFKDFISIFFWLIVQIAEIIPSDQSVPNPVNVWLRIH